MYYTDFDGCQYHLRPKHPKGPYEYLKKPWTFATNLPECASVFNKLCPGTSKVHQHVSVCGPNALHSQYYTPHMTLTIHCVIFRHFRNKYLREYPQQEADLWSIPVNEPWWSENPHTNQHSSYKPKLHLALCRTRSSSLLTQPSEHNTGALAQRALRSFRSLCSLETAEPSPPTTGIAGTAPSYQAMPRPPPTPSPKSPPPDFNAAQPLSTLPALSSTDGTSSTQVSHTGQSPSPQTQPSRQPQEVTPHLEDYPASYFHEPCKQVRTRRAMTSCVDKLYVAQLLKAIQQVATRRNISITQEECNGIASSIVEECPQADITELLFTASTALEMIIMTFATQTLELSRDAAASASHCDTPAEQATTQLPITNTADTAVNPTPNNDPTAGSSTEGVVQALPISPEIQQAFDSPRSLDDNTDIEPLAAPIADYNSTNPIPPSEYSFHTAGDIIPEQASAMTNPPPPTAGPIPGVTTQQINDTIAPLLPNESHASTSNADPQSTEQTQYWTNHSWNWHTPSYDQQMSNTPNTSLRDGDQHSFQQWNTGWEAYLHNRTPLQPQTTTSDASGHQPAATSDTAANAATAAQSDGALATRNTDPDLLRNHAVDNPAVLSPPPGLDLEHPWAPFATHNLASLPRNSHVRTTEGSRPPIVIRDNLQPGDITWFYHALRQPDADTTWHGIELGIPSIILLLRNDDEGCALRTQLEMDSYDADKHPLPYQEAMQSYLIERRIPTGTSVKPWLEDILFFWFWWQCLQPTPQTPWWLHWDDNKYDYHGVFVCYAHGSAYSYDSYGKTRQSVDISETVSYTHLTLPTKA